jgi:glucose/arabinose dehydrogenase
MHATNLPKHKALSAAVALALGSLAAMPMLARADGVNKNCPEESVYYNPSNGQDIIVPKGFKVEAFITGLNFPTDIAFAGNKVYVLESGTGLPGKCNNRVGYGGDATGFGQNNPFTPDILVFNSSGTKIGGPIGKPTGPGNGFQPDGPAIGLAFEHNFEGGTLYATDSNQGVRGATSGGGNNTSRIVRVDLSKNTVSTVIHGLPTGDHPTEQLIVKDGWLYWSQGSATNSGVTGHDNGGGGNQHDIACQQITLSENTWRAVSDSHVTTGYSDHGKPRPNATVPAFESATSKGMCTGAILRAKISNPQNSIEPVAWGFRNPYGLRFSPADHPLKGEIMVSENGEDERGARPTNNSPDRLAIARQNPDGTPEYHGWPDRFGFLDSTQSVFIPKGSPADDDPSLAGQTIKNVFAFFPQHPVAPLALEPSDVAAVGLDFAPKSFVGGIVKKNAVLVSREGDFGFSQANGTPEAGHDVELVNFTSQSNPYEITLTRFAFNCRQGEQAWDPVGTKTPSTPKCKGETEQAFVMMARGINRPTTIRFGPDGAAYLVDYGAVRDPGGSDRGSQFLNPANAPLVQIPGTGTIWKITRIGGGGRGDDDDNDNNQHED